MERESLMLLEIKRPLDDGRELMVFPLTYGRARLGISANKDSQAFDDEW